MPDPQPAVTAPDAAQTAPTPPATPAPHAVPVDPNGPPATLEGQPLTYEASYEDLLRADPPPAQVQPPPQVVHEVQGQPAGTADAEAQAPEGATSDGEQAPASDDTEDESAHAEAAAPVVDEEREVQRLVQQKMDLLRTQGRKNQELGDLRQEVRALREELVARANQPQMPSELPPDEELAARLLDKPSQYLLTPSQVKEMARQEAAAMLAQQAHQWQEQQSAEAALIAPEEGKIRFLVRNGIKDDFDTWIATDEGKAVNALFERDPDRAALLETYRDRGDERGIANTLTKALQAHRIGKKAAQGRAKVSQEQERIAASRPPSLPARQTPPPPLPQGDKSIFDPWDESDLANFLRNSPPYQNT